MGKKIRLREAQQRVIELALAARLRDHSGAKRRSAFITNYCAFEPGFRSKIEAYRAFASRAPEDWRCALRVRSPELRFLDLVRFTFARYPVAAHLEAAWIDDPGAAPRNPLLLYAQGENETPDLKAWYIAVAQGRSLHRDAAHRYLSAQETHYFVTAPAEVTCTPRAFWFAMARAAAPDAAAAIRVARTKLVDFPVASPFWRDVARFFARQAASVQDMNDVADYLVAARHEDADFSLKGRTLGSLQRRMHDWHRALHERRHQQGRLNCCDMPDTEFPSRDGSGVWRFRQLRSGADLAEEGRRMSHCVASYQAFCETGKISIWSMTRNGDASRQHGLTIELRQDRVIAQCRGFANRLPSSEERLVVDLWARGFRLTWGSQ